MRNLLAFLAALVIAFLGVGWYLGWYSVHSVPAGAGHSSYTIDIDEPKIKDAVRSGEEKLHDVLQKAKSSESTRSADKKTPVPGSDAFNGLRNFPRILSDMEEQVEPAKSASKQPPS
jgi:hypothetical protein